MASEKTYRLTGGVFFLLISQCLKNTGKTEVDCLSELAAIFDKTNKFVTRKTMRSNITQYKKCELDNSMFLPFGNRNLRQVFSAKMEQDYNSILAEMGAFTKKYIPQNDYSWLASAIDDILQHDSSAVNEQFQITSDGATASYQELLDMKEVEIEPFLTGIWGFILSRRPHNTDGAETIHALTSEADTKGNPRPFVSDIGKSLQKKAISMNQESTNKNRRAFILPGETVTPELSSDMELFIVNDIGDNSEKPEFEDYFNRLKKSYNKITTLLYADEPQPFYDFYVCNEICRIEVGRSRQRVYIKNVTVDMLLEHSNYVLLSGNGGLGKSMMMRHLLLDCIDRYEEVSLLPVFMELRSFEEANESLSDYAYHMFMQYGGDKSREEFDNLLNLGVILLLCDGLDEVQSEKRAYFQQELERFTITFPQNPIVISSRPFGPFSSHASLRRFTVFYLNPFDLQQATELVQKLKFHEDKPEIKHKFLTALKTQYYRTHHSFAENPLLLTIMMMMYAQIGDIPSRMHLFYNEAFQVLARKHDATKGYNRPLETKLDVEAFKEMFSEFCARTYKDERIELTDDEMETHYKNLKIIRDGKHSFSFEAFAKDLTSNLCLLYYESLKYHFIHRSFQEYFCAVYISKRLDKNLYKLALAFFENKRLRSSYDNAFDMLYHMIKERIEENVFIPYLDNLFEECDKGDGYETFLAMIYPDIAYNYGTVSSDFFTESGSFLYNYIIRTSKLNFPVEDYDLPYNPDFVIEEYVELDEEWLSMHDLPGDTIVPSGEVDVSYVLDMGAPDVVGYNLAFVTVKAGFNLTHLAG